MVFGNARQIAPIHRIKAERINFQAPERRIGHGAVRRPFLPSARNPAHADSKRPAIRGVPRERLAISRAPSSDKSKPSLRAPRVTMPSNSSGV
jgi:hypothetical protein